MEKGNDVKEEIQNILAITLARAAAIVYGQVLSNEEMVSLVDNLFACPSPNYTPDGKTVLTTIKEEASALNVIHSLQHASSFF